MERTYKTAERDMEHKCRIFHCDHRGDRYCKFIEQISEISSQCQIAFFNKSEHTSGAINERDEMP